MEIVARILKRLGALQGLRSPHEATWRECFNFTFPLRGSGFQSDELNAQSGQDRRAMLVDSTGTDAARILASGIMSGVTPANSLWFQLGVADASDEERRWLEAAGQTTFEAIHGANFDSAGFECALDVVSAGWFVLYIDSDPATKGLSFEEWPLSECLVGASKAGGKIDMVYRPFRLSAQACVAEYGEECSEVTRELAKTKPDDMVDLVRVIEPRSQADGYVAGSMLSKRMPIASCHVEVKQKKLLREGGYNEMPAIVARWHKLPASPYAVGPAFDALPDLKTLNQLARDELANADLTLAGMWIAEDDGVLNPRTVKVGPRKIIVANSVDSMKPLVSGGNWQYSVELSNRLQANIRKVFMADQLQPADGPQMTATEVHVRVALIRQLLGPVYGRLQSEYLAPMIERCFGLLSRMGAFPPPPESLANRTYQVHYISPLARAQRQEEITAMDTFETTLIQEAQVNPNSLDTYDWDGAAAERGKLLGVPAKLLRSADEIAAVRDARQKAQQAAAAAAAMNTGAQSFAAAKGESLGAH